MEVKMLNGLRKVEAGYGPWVSGKQPAACSVNHGVGSRGLRL